MNHEATLRAVRERSERAVNQPLNRRVRGLLPVAVPTPPVDLDPATDTRNLLALAPRLVANALARGQAKQLFS